jgi:alpha-L-fucosidase 2
MFKAMARYAPIAFCVFTLLTLTGAVVGENAPDRFLPSEALNPKLAAPIDTWDEAIPLGNGPMGGLFWGRDHTIRLSLDRGDLWDLRVQDEIKKDDWNWKTIQTLVAEKNQAEMVRRLDAPYLAPWPTKLPAGRLELKLDPTRRITSFTLDLAHAVGRAELGSGAPLETFFSAVEPVAMMRIPGRAPMQWKLIAPSAVKILGYPEAKSGGDGDTKWFIQESVTGFRYAVVASARRDGESTLLAMTITTSGDSPDPIEMGRKRLAVALRRGYANMLAPHEVWWRDFWRKSRVELPDLNHLRHYYLVQYFYGAASRLGSPPMPLQGVWTEDSGGLPPWKGDYHHDLNTQMTYAAYQTAGRMDEGRCFLEFMWKLLPEFRTFARKFYNAPGAAVPAVMALDGKPLGGWGMYSLQPTNAAWIGYLFYQHWRYTMDEVFLRDRAYPWCAEIGRCLLRLLTPDASGVWKLPLSSSPEIHDNSLRAWLKPNSNYDHDCMAVLFAALAEMADAFGKNEEAAQWRAAIAALGPRAVDPQTNRLMLAPGENLGESHRHLSHTMSIHPFGLLTIEGSDHDRAIIAATCRQYDELGTRVWCGFSFSWMACLRARAGDADAALKYLDIFEKAFVLRNGFHANGDQLKAGYSAFTYRPFTLEGNFLASQAVHEMLLQSWSGVIRVFPAMPTHWHRAAFDDLRAEGGYRVSARRDNNATMWLKVAASRDGLVRIRDNFGGATPAWSRPDAKKVGSDWQWQLRAGEAVEARLPTRQQAPPVAKRPVPEKYEMPFAASSGAHSKVARTRGPDVTLNGLESVTTTLSR